MSLDTAHLEGGDVGIAVEAAEALLDALEAEIIRFALRHYRGHMSEVSRRLATRTDFDEFHSAHPRLDDHDHRHTDVAQ